MPEIKIYTITPVHIGSGVKLIKNLDFFEDTFKKLIYIADHQKIFDMVGLENIEKWTKAIENNQDILPIIKAKKPDVKLNDLAQRTIPFLQTTALKQQDIALQLHSGTGKPLLPGSSLKGAIRTAIFTEIIWEDTIWSDINKLFEYKFNYKTKTSEPKVNDKKIIEHTFGKPEDNFMKFLRVGDAHFEQTVLAEVWIANKKGEEWRFNVKGKPNIVQQVECIAAYQKATIQIQWPNELLIFSNDKLKNLVEANYAKHINHLKFLDRLLFKVLNNHTLRLIENEIYLMNKHYDDILQNYLQKLEQLNEQIKNAKPNECYLRLGFATGYLNMTGDWLEEEFISQNLKNEIRKKLRAIVGEIYPKTRRFLVDGTPLGFIKLEL